MLKKQKKSGRRIPFSRILLSMMSAVMLVMALIHVSGTIIAVIPAAVFARAAILRALGRIFCPAIGIDTVLTAIAILSTAKRTLICRYLPFRQPAFAIHASLYARSHILQKRLMGHTGTGIQFQNNLLRFAGFFFYKIPCFT